MMNLTEDDFKAAIAQLELQDVRPPYTAYIPWATAIALTGCVPEEPLWQRYFVGARGVFLQEPIHEQD